MEKVIDSIKKNVVYDFISNNYNNYSKEELKDILLEYIYSHYTDMSNTEIIYFLNEKYKTKEG